MPKGHDVPFYQQFASKVHKSPWYIKKKHPFSCRGDDLDLQLLTLTFEFDLLKLSSPISIYTRRYYFIYVLKLPLLFFGVGVLWLSWSLTLTFGLYNILIYYIYIVNIIYYVQLVPPPFAQDRVLTTPLNKNFTLYNLAKNHGIVPYT